MSDLELIKMCINDLGNINVPVSLIQQIGLPLERVAQNLTALYEAVVKALDEGKKDTDSAELEGPLDGPRPLEELMHESTPES